MTDIFDTPERKAYKEWLYKRFPLNGIARDPVTPVETWDAAVKWMRSQQNDEIERLRAELDALRGQEPAVRYVPIADATDRYGNHPNDREPRDDALRSQFREMGDDAGQGLSPYWKWAFAAGWNACKRRRVPQSAITDDAVQRLRHAIEGECDGLDIDEHHARAVLEYVLAAPKPGGAQ